MSAWTPNLKVELSTDSFDEPSPTWTDISAYVREVEIRRGRNNQLERVGPSIANVVLSNGDRRFDPAYDDGPFRNPPPYLNVPGTGADFASLADSPAVDITGDIDIRADVAMNDWTPSGNPSVIAKWGSGATHSWTFRVLSTGRLQLIWTSDGITNRDAISTVATGFADGTRMWIRVTLDVDDGNGNWVATFYTSLDGRTWSQLGSPVVNAGAATIFASTANIEVSGLTSGAANVMAGKVYQVIVCDGIDGTRVVDCPFWEAGAAAAPNLGTAGGEFVLHGGCTMVASTDTTPLLRPMNRIRVTASVNGNDYPRFYGYVQSWPQQYDESNQDAVVTVNAVDLFGYLANVRLGSAWEHAVNATEPASWYRFFDSIAVGPRDSIIGDIGFYYGNVETAEVLIPSAAGAVRIGSASSVTLGSGVVMMLRDRYYLNTGSWSVAIVFSKTGFAAPGAVQAIWSMGEMYMAVDDVGRLMFIDSRSAIQDISVLATESSVCDGRAHIAVITAQLGTSWVYDLWIDGAAVDTGDIALYSGIGINPLAQKLVIGANPDPQLLVDDVENLVVDEFLAWDRALSGADIEQLADAVSGFDGDTAAERIGRILTAAGYTGTAALESGERRCGDHNLAGSALQLLQQVDATEQGRFFIAADGTPTLHNRHHNITASRSITTQATFSDDAVARSQTGASDVPFYGPGPTLTMDVAQTINEVTVTSPTIPSGVVAGDDTTQAVYGVQARSIETIARSPRDAESVGRYLVLKYAEPQLRADTWTVKPERKPVVWSTVLGLELGDRVIVERTPQNVGDQIQIPLYLEYIQEKVTPDDWVITFGGVPAEPEASTDYWQLGLSQLGVDTRLYV